MEWKKFNEGHLKEGTIARTKAGKFVLVGEINTSTGSNDEFTETITDYTEHFVPQALEMLKQAEIDFNK